VNVQTHGDHGVAPIRDYDFAAGALALPLTRAEFIQAAAHYPIVFAQNETATPLVVLGIKERDLDTQDCGRRTPASTRSLSTTAAAGFIGETAEAFVRTGRIAEGLAVIEAGFGQSEAGWLTPELLRLKGELSLSQSTRAAAETADDLFRQALTGARQQQALAWELRAAMSLARLLRNQGRHADSIACLEPVYGRFTEGFGTADLIAAKQLLDELSGAGRR